MYGVWCREQGGGVGSRLKGEGFRKKDVESMVYRSGQGSGCKETGVVFREQGSVFREQREGCTK